MKLTIKTLLLSLLLLTPTHIYAAEEFKFVGEFGGKGEDEAQFAKTLSMAFGEDGDIYITDTDNFRIHKYTETGNYAFQIQVDESSDFRFINPTAITIGADNTIYVMDWLLKHITETDNPKVFNYAPCVHKFDPQGKFIASYPIRDLSKRVNYLDAAAPGLDSEGNYALIIPHGTQNANSY